MRRRKCRHTQVKTGEGVGVKPIGPLVTAAEARARHLRVRTHQYAEGFERAELVSNRALAQVAVVELVRHQAFYRQRFGVRAVRPRQGFRGAGHTFLEEPREPGSPHRTRARHSAPGSVRFPTDARLTGRVKFCCSTRDGSPLVGSMSTRSVKRDHGLRAAWHTLAKGTSDAWADPQLVFSERAGQRRVNSFRFCGCWFRVDLGVPTPRFTRPRIPHSTSWCWSDDVLSLRTAALGSGIRSTSPGHEPARVERRHSQRLSDRRRVSRSHAGRASVR